MDVTEFERLTATLPAPGVDIPQPARLGIMGGTFDPIHIGHLVTAQQAADDLALDKVVFMPAGDPAFKQNRPVSPAEMRYQMTCAATADNPLFCTSRFEIERKGITYTADTLELMRTFYPPEVELYFITGADAIIEIVTWHDAAKIARMAKLVGATRPGYDLGRARMLIAESSIDFDVTYLEVPALAISSSYLRERCRAGQAITYLTPHAVIDYIKREHLYEGAAGALCEEADHV